MNTLQRSNSAFSFSLASVASRTIVDVGPANTVTMYADREFGSSWSTFVISVKKITVGSSVAADFDTAKSFPAGGGVVSLSVADMLGVERIELAWASGAAEASGTTARITLTAEARVYNATETSLTNVGTIGVTQLNSTGGQTDAPSDPSE